ncbi:hypothetical protein L202_06189 [Cryptococcus amylolentus CBS 6039]|uniref:HMG domain-containing protein n=1 Tax=Cryptococcus amylolentus CBS 6039 TaxID=1295533 RepID=A0A1E3HIT1_9TREE|nr:hypothetical protein L202_06189 [Cryptococcus amylolentus CBS 6039]ODN76259.1 hypothetical protein L202_06189 [Cryptococcus amylolentus CBS 6039]
MGDAIIFRVNESTWALTEWDSKKKEPLIQQLCHLRYKNDSVDCDCPARISCVHRAIFENCFQQFNSLQQPDLGVESTREIVFLAMNMIHPLVVSVQESCSHHDSSSNTHKRVIVVLQSDRRWKCSGRSCPQRVVCDHVKAVTKRCQERQLLDEDGEPTFEFEAFDPDERRDQFLNATSTFPPNLHISSRPRAPPAHMLLASDPAEYFPSPHPKAYPDVFPLDKGSRCRCGEQWLGPQGGQYRELSPYRVYTFTGAVDLLVQIVKCPRCSSGRGRIGPDLLEVGIVNYNNDFGFAREVFDLFILAFTETGATFASWHRVVEHMYAYTPSSQHSPKFVSISTFRRCFFEFLTLMKGCMEAEMECAECGPYPKTVIADSVALAFGARYVEGGLRPPTLPTTRSLNRPGVKRLLFSSLECSLFNMNAATFNVLREECRAWMTKKGSLDDMPQAVVEFLHTPAAREIPFHEPLTLISSLAISILEIFHGRSIHGVIFNEAQMMALRAYMGMIMSRDSIFSLFPPPFFHEIDTFCIDHTSTPELRRHVPAISNLCHAFPDLPIDSSPILLDLLFFLNERARSLWKTMLDRWQQTEALDPEIAHKVEEKFPGEIPWEASGFCGPGEKQRDRDLYPNIADDAGMKRVKGGAVKVSESHALEGDCKKYYNAQKATKGMTGGIASLWCPHGICCAYRLMPTSEERDDFFSMIYCYWPEAPDLVIYDFACSLGPYCFLRAPSYWAKTRFLVGEPHAQGHSKCSAINSSIAESNHLLLNRLRKSLSYMNERDSSMYLWIVIQSLNRSSMLRKGWKQKGIV